MGERESGDANSSHNWTFGCFHCLAGYIFSLCSCFGGVPIHSVVENRNGTLNLHVQFAHIVLLLTLRHGFVFLDLFFSVIAIECSAFFSLLWASRFDATLAHTYMYKMYTVRLLFREFVCVWATFCTYIMWYCISYPPAASFLHFALEKCTIVCISLNRQRRRQLSDG